MNPALLPQCHKVNLGMIDYETAWSLQQTLAEARVANQIVDTLLLLEHPPVYTIGRSGKREHLLMSQERRDELGISVLDVDRGGDITFHGPGQLVVYPIRFLGVPDASGRIMQADFIGYIRQLEEILIKTVGVFGIAAQRVPGLTGVWARMGGELAKLAAIGVHINARGVSTHGIALNVTTDLGYFEGIIPCGIHEKRVCSMELLLGSKVPSIEEVQDQFAAHFGEIFGVSVSSCTLESLLAVSRARD
jgi:lipoate-protein ligase B